MLSHADAHSIFLSQWEAFIAQSKSRSQKDSSRCLKTKHQMTTRSLSLKTSSKLATVAQPGPSRLTYMKSRLSLYTWHQPEYNLTKILSFKRSTYERFTVLCNIAELPIAKYLCPIRQVYNTSLRLKYPAKNSKRLVSSCFSSIVKSITENEGDSSQNLARQVNIMHGFKWIL